MLMMVMAAVAMIDDQDNNKRSFADSLMISLLSSIERRCRINHSARYSLIYFS